MYIPEIIMLVIIVALGFYSSHITSKHNKELEDLREKLNKEHLESLRERTASSERYYEAKIKELNDLVAKLKEGTKIGELEAEIERLKQEVYRLEDEKYDLLHAEEE